MSGLQSDINIADLIQNIKNNKDKRDNKKMLKDAKIIDDDGFYLAGYFSEETINKDKNEI